MCIRDRCVGGFWYGNQKRTGRRFEVCFGKLPKRGLINKNNPTSD
jgi:hypothetical protein